MLFSDHKPIGCVKIYFYLGTEFKVNWSQDVLEFEFLGDCGRNMGKISELQSYH